MRVLWPTLGRVASWLVPLRGVFSCGGWCAGFVARCACSMAVLFPPVLDSNPARSLGPPAKRFAHIVWVGFDSSAVRWGPRSCLVGLPPAFAPVGGAWASLFSLSGPCSRGCRAAWADAPSGGVRVFPVYLRSGRCRCCCVRVGNARSPCLGDGVVSVRGGAGA